MTRGPQLDFVEPIRRRLYDWAKRHEEAEYTGQVTAADPSRHLVLHLILWGVLFLAGTQTTQYLAPGWVVAVVAIPWLLISGALVRFGMARYHGLSIPEYSDYLDKRTDSYREKKDREQARKLERQINSDIQDLKEMDVVESVAVWGDEVDVELRQVQEAETDE